MGNPEFFMEEDGIRRRIDKIGARGDALERSFRPEKERLGCDQAMRRVLGDDGILMATLDAEEMHLSKIMEYRTTGAGRSCLGYHDGDQWNIALAPVPGREPSYFSMCSQSPAV